MSKFLLHLLGYIANKKAYSQVDFSTTYNPPVPLNPPAAEAKDIAKPFGLYTLYP